MPDGRPLTIAELKMLAGHPRLAEVLPRLTVQEREALERLGAPKSPLAGASRATGIEATPSGLAGSRERGTNVAETVSKGFTDLGGFETAAGAAGTAVTGTPLGGMAAAALTRMLRGNLEGETTEESAPMAILQGATEGIPLIGKALKGTSRFFMNSALKPGLRVLDDAGQAITGPGKTLSARFPDTDIVGETLARRRPVRNSGLAQTQVRLAEARGQAVDAVDAFSKRRPRVAGLLPEGRLDIPLGETPGPSGAVPSFSPSHATERVPFNAQRARQGLSEDPTVTQFYGGTPAVNAAEATADVVGGPGVVRRTFSEAGVSPGPSASLIPGEGQMIGIEEAMIPARRKLTEMADTAMPARKQSWQKMIDDYTNEYPAPADANLALRRKDVAADEASNLYRQRAGVADDEGAASAQFQEMIAEGNRTALEQRVPNIRALNTETQTELAIREALLGALDKESRSSRFNLSGLLDNPRLWGTTAHVANRIGTPIASTLTPATLRVVKDLIIPSHETPERRRPR